MFTPNIRKQAEILLKVRQLLETRQQMYDCLALLLEFDAILDLLQKNEQAERSDLDSMTKLHGEIKGIVEHMASIVKNLEYIADYLVSEPKSKFCRRTKEHSKEQDTEYRRAEAASEFNILRSEPLICTLLKQMHNQKTD